MEIELQEDQGTKVREQSWAEDCRNAGTQEAEGSQGCNVMPTGAGRATGEVGKRFQKRDD